VALRAPGVPAAERAAALVGRRAGVPSIYTPHGWGFERPGSRGARVASALLERQLAHRYHARIVTLSAAAKAAAERWRVAPRGRVQVIPMGLPGAPSLTTAAARSELRIQRDTFVAAWVGSELDRGRAAAALRDNGVVLVPLGRRPATVYAAADVLVHASSGRTFPIEVRDAMAARLPIVAYDASEVREHVQAGRTGYLVAPGDLEMICDCVLALASTPATRLKMGHAGHRRAATTFSYAAMIEQLGEAYAAVAGRARRPLA